MKNVTSITINGTAVSSEPRRVVGTEITNFIRRVEKLEAEKAEIAESITSVLSEAASRGYDKKILKQIVKLRKMTAEEREEQEALLDLYESAMKGKE